MSMTPEKATALRRPFPPESVGQLPKGGTMLDYVGHAAVTDRLLTVDPEWAWEPMAVDEHGNPQPDVAGNLWIKLTVCGVTRIGVGDGKNMKERIGDAIRNAAMRFGVALDLWAKENLVEFAQAAQSHQAHPEAATDEDELIGNLKAQLASQPGVRRPSPPADGEPMADNTRKQMFAEFGKHKVPADAQLAGINSLLGTAYTSRGDLTEAHAKRVIADLKSRPVGVAS